MATATKKKEAPPAADHVAIIKSAPRLARLLPAARYLGPCAVQAPGGWCRVGPTWLVPQVGYVVYGPGAGRWGTTRGLAQLTSDADAAPTWHASGLAVAPTPNVVYVVTGAARSNPNMAPVLEIEAQVVASDLVGGTHDA